MGAGGHGERGGGVGAGAAVPVPQRGAIPAALMSGRTQNSNSSAPSQLPFDLGPVSALGPAATQADAPSGSSPPTPEVGSAAA